MATVILRPSSIGDHNVWTLMAGATKQAAVDPGASVSHDDFTTYLQDTSGNKQSFYVVTGKPSAIAVVNSLGMGARFWGDWTTGATSFGAFARLNGTDGTEMTSTTGDSVWVNLTSAGIARPGGGSWTPTDIANATLQAGARSGVSGLNTSLTSLWFALDYIPASGGYLAIVDGLIGAAIGLHEMARIAKVVFARTRTLITPEEYVAMWEELKFNPRRRIFA